MKMLGNDYDAVTIGRDNHGNDNGDDGDNDGDE